MVILSWNWCALSVRKTRKLFVREMHMSQSVWYKYQTSEKQLKSCHVQFKSRVIHLFILYKMRSDVFNWRRLLFLSTWGVNLEIKAIYELHCLYFTLQMISKSSQSVKGNFGTFIETLAVLLLFRWASDDPREQSC